MMVSPIPVRGIDDVSNDDTINSDTAQFKGNIVDDDHWNIKFGGTYQYWDRNLVDNDFKKQGSFDEIKFIGTITDIVDDDADEEIYDNEDIHDGDNNDTLACSCKL